MKATRKKEASSETQYVPNTCDACSDGAAKLVVAINLLRIEQDRRHDDLPDGGYGLSEKRSAFSTTFAKSCSRR